MDWNSIIPLLKRHIPDSGDLIDYVNRSRPRYEYTVSLLSDLHVRGASVCEIGFGAIGIASALELGARIEAYDIDETYAPLCRSLGIPHHRIDLAHRIAPLPEPRYDVLVLCEVIEHISRSPQDVLRELQKWIRPGGTLLFSTVNLSRLSNRLRLLAGKELFARYGPGSFHMGHQREFTLSEIEHYIISAGYRIDKGPFYFAQPDLLSAAPVRAAYICLTKLMPSLSNLIFVLARRPA
jgi:2-polyprenyl-3-methyl-5-hydroxy-6-metoxy-1,4-benzoquinol methylase